MPSDPLRIGFDAIRALRNTTGLGNYARAMLRALHRHDPRLDMHLYAPDAGRAEFGDLPRELEATLHLPPRPATAISRALWRTFRLGRAAAGDCVALYHGLTHEIPRDLPRTGVPAVVTVHDLIYEKHGQYFPLIDRTSYRWRYRWSAQHANAITAVSAQTRDDLIDHYRLDPQRIVVIPPPRDENFSLRATDSEKTAVRTKYGLPAQFLLCVGTLEPRKNQQVLVTAMARLSPGAAPPLVLVGRDGGSAPALRQQVNALGLGLRVYLRTEVISADLPALMQTAAAFLYPSRAEGFGIPVVEALSAATPAIASEGGCLEEAGGPGSRYVDAADVDAWASAIEQVLTDTGLANRMRVAGTEYARRFDGHRLAARMRAVYDAVIAGVALPADSRDEAVVERVRG